MLRNSVWFPERSEQAAEVGADRHFKPGCARLRFAQRVAQHDIDAILLQQCLFEKFAVIRPRPEIGQQHLQFKYRMLGKQQSLRHELDHEVLIQPVGRGTGVVHLVGIDQHKVARGEGMLRTAHIQLISAA